MKAAITGVGQGVKTTHGGDVPAAFERAVRVAVQNREFWRAFIEVPDIDVDTAAIARAWGAAREAVLTVLRAKAAAPLEAGALPPNAVAAIAAYEAHRTAIANLSAALQAHNAQIAIVKERAAGANVATLTADLAKLNAIKSRHEASIATLCEDYLRRRKRKR